MAGSVAAGSMAGRDDLAAAVRESGAAGLYSAKHDGYPAGAALGRELDLDLAEALEVFER